MKRTKHCQMRTRHQSSYPIGIAIYLICAQWISADSAFANAAVTGSVVEDKVTLPSRNDATNPLKEPTPSTLQVAFLGGNLTDANNGSTSTPPTDAHQRHHGDDDEVSVLSTTTAAAAAETVWNARTAAVATLPVDQRNESVTATKSDPATTNRPLESWENVVHTSTEQPSSSSPPRPPPTTDSTAERTTVTHNNGNRGAEHLSNNNNNLMANMLKSWFNRKDNTATAAKDYYKLAAEYLQKNRDDNGPVSRTVSQSSLSKSVAVAGGNKNLFERWDEASEEQERVLEDAMRSESTVADDGGGGSSSSSSSSSSSVLAADQNNPSQWFVLLLSGNSTVAQMRRTDFAKYLKLNLAARLSLDYDEVKINRVLVVPPHLMVNVSVVPVPERASVAAAAAAAATAAAASPSSSSSSSSSPGSPSASDAAISDRVTEDDDPLHNLVETNATLMELSGEEYRVEKFMSLKSQKPQSMEEAAAVVSNRHADIDFFIYATVGPLCFVVVLGFLLYTLYKYVRKHPVQWPWKRKLRQPSFWPGGDHQHRHRRMTDECCGGGGECGGGAPLSSTDEMHGGGGSGGTINVIYSGEFEQSQQQQLSGSWLDDASFVPDDSLDRIRTPTLLQRTVTPPAAKNKTFTEMLQQCSDGGGGVVVVGASDDNQRHRHRHDASRGVQCSAVAATGAVHAQSPRLSRENKLRILGCKQSCLLLPAVQPVAVADNKTPQQQPLPNQSTAAAREDSGDGSRP